MSRVHKVAGQSAPAANANTDLYTVPTNKNFVTSTLVVVNRSDAAAIAIRMAVVPKGATIANQHYIEYGRLIAPRESVRLTMGMTLASGDKVIVHSSANTASFSLFGAELDN